MLKGDCMKTNKIVLTAFFIALGIVIPFITAHGFSLPGTLLLPMHIPVLVGGFILGPLYGLILGALTPLVSMLITGMPHSLMLPIMSVELALYGCMSGLFYRQFKFNIYVSLVLAMLVGRIGYGLAWYVPTSFLNMAQFAKVASVSTAFVNGLVGIIIQLVLIPPLVHLLKKEMPND